VPYRVVAERRVTERLFQTNAVWPGHGQPLADLRGGDRRALRRLLASGVVRDEGAGSYYVFAPAYAAMRGHRRQRLILVLLFVVLALALTAIAARLA
jgi:hypothetical protein